MPLIITPDTQIRTIGLYQPFATLMLHGKIETRWIRRGTKPPFPKGVYLFYSTIKEYHETDLKPLCGDQFPRAMKYARHDKSLLNGHAIAIGELKAHIWITPSMEDQTFVKYDEGRVVVNKKGKPIIYDMCGLVFENVTRIKPFPFVNPDGTGAGKQGVGFLAEWFRNKIVTI